MALSTSDSSISYVGNDSDVIPYAIPFPFLDAGDIKLSVATDGVVEIVDPVDYTVTRLEDGTGGSLTTRLTYPNTTFVTVYRELELTQPTEVPTGGAFPASSFETALDRLAMQVQQIQAQVSRFPGITPPGIVQPGGYLEATPDTVSGIDGSGDLISRDREDMVDFLQIADPTGGAERAEAAAAQAEDAVASIASYAFPGAVDYTELRAMSGIAGTSRTLVGVGGGEFWWTSDTIADDGGIYISATGGGTWVRKFDTFVSVLWYGCDPTGVTECSAEFQAALDTGRSVWVPPGQYNLAVAPRIYTTGQVLFGDSLSTSILNISGSDVRALDLEQHTHPTVSEAPGAIAQSLQWAAVRDLRFRYVSGTTSTKSGIILLPRDPNPTSWNGEGCRLERVHVEGWDVGIEIDWASKFQVIHCHAKSCLSKGVYIHGNPNNCFRAETLSASDCPIGLHLEDAAGATISLGDFALNDVGVLMDGGNCFFYGGELESYEDTFLRTTGNADATIISTRFLGRKVPVKAEDRSRVKIHGCTWNISGTYYDDTVGDGTVGPYPISGPYHDSADEIEVYLLDSLGSNVWELVDPADYIYTGDGSYGVETAAVEFLVPIPATTTIRVTLNQFIGEQVDSTAQVQVDQGSSFQYTNVYDFSTQRSNRIKLASGKVVTGGLLPIASDLVSTLHKDNIGLFAIRESGFDPRIVTEDLDGDPVELSLKNPNLPAREITSTGTVYSTGFEYFVRKNGGQFVLLDPDHANYKASPQNARTIHIRNTSGSGTMTLGRNNGATLMNGTAANITIPINGSATAITTGDDDDWTVQVHAVS